MDAVGPVFGGYSQASQYKSQAKLAEQQAKDVSLQATQTSEQRREQLNAALANVSANRAQSGLSADSPTGVAINSAIKASAHRSEAIGRVGSLNQQQSLGWQAAAYRSAGKNAITGGFIDGFNKVGKAAAMAMGA